MWISRRLRINLLFSTCLATLLLFTSGCSEEVTSETESAQPDKVIDISVPGYSGKAILAINTSTTGTGLGDIGISPKTISSFTLSEHSTNIPPVKDLPNTPPEKGLSLSGYDDAIETLTESNTTHTFETYDFEVNSGAFPVTVSATLRYGSSTSKCLIYVQDGYSNLLRATDSGTQEISTDWTSIGETFDTQIYTRLTEKYGPAYDVDSNEKAIFLFYDVDPEGKENASSNGYIAGYFWSPDITPDEDYYTNKKDMIYMNLVTNGLTHSLQTLAHEYTHLVAYSVRRISDLNELGRDLGNIDTWLNEGIAEAAAHYALDDVLEDSIRHMKTGAPIRNGQIGFFDWSRSGYDYPLVYSFVQYARIQSNLGYDLFSDLLQHSSTTHTGLESLVVEGNSAFSDISDIVRGFHIANVVNQETGIYGYKDERDDFSFSNLSAPNTTVTGILPGAGVYFYPSDNDTNNFIPVDSDSEIYYYRINADD